ncbi:MAG: PqqD family protein [Wujia sp.]
MRKKRDNYMDHVFYRHPALQWHISKTGNIEIDIHHTGIYDRLAQRLFHTPEFSHIMLDSYGSVLWNMINGNNTVYDIVQGMMAVFPGDGDAICGRVLLFMCILQQNNLIRERCL